MSLFVGSGTITGNTPTDWVACRGWATLAGHYDAGSGNMTWSFSGADGVERSIYGGTDGTTEQVFTASHMINIYFGTDVKVRGTVDTSSGLTLDWQIMSSPFNRGD